MKKFGLFFLFLLFSFPLSGEEVFAEEYQYFLDIPEGWILLDAQDLSKITFSDPTGNAFLKVIVHTGSKFKSASEISDYVRSTLNAAGDQLPFQYMTLDSIFADYSFVSDNLNFRGYFVLINTDQYDYILFAITVTEYYDVFQAFLLSCLDSFSINETARYYPGPVTQWFNPFPGEEKKTAEISLFGAKKTVQADLKEAEDCQVLIEREAIVLMNYQENDIEAWCRFYRMIYKDTYHRLDWLYLLVMEEMQERKWNKQDLILNLLKWIQSFEFIRPGGYSDFYSPLRAVLAAEGDCDSLAMLYIILLHHLNIDSVLFISPVYKHSGAGVNNAVLNRKGAQIAYNGRNYLYAELTDNVDIGLISADMADPAGWVVVPLGVNLY